MAAMGVPYDLVVATNAAVIGPLNRATGFVFPEALKKI
jgi:hypothetical protein